MKVQFFCDNELTLIDNVELMNGLLFCPWTSDINPEEGYDGLTGKFANVYKVHFMDGTGGYVEANILAAIANGEFEVIEE